LYRFSSLAGYSASRNKNFAIGRRPPATNAPFDEQPAACKTVESKQLGHRGMRLAPVPAVH
jgi:hypothetical protein